MFNEALSKSALKDMKMIFVMSREFGGFSCDTLRSLFTDCTGATSIGIWK